MTYSGSIPPYMKAVFLDKPGGMLIVKEVKTPVPGPGEVLVRIKAAPVNPSDLARLKRNDFETETFNPGLEGSGVVTAAGKGLLPWLWMGKRVACSSEYSYSGTWSEYLLTKAGKCFPLSSKIDYDQGAMMLVNPLTAIGFFEIIRAQGHRAIISNAAASALGRMIELLGNKHNIPVINIVRNKLNLEKLTGSGSKYVLDSSAPSFIDDLRKLSFDLNATILFDSTCSSQIEKMTEVLPDGSSVIIYGNLTGEKNIMINPRILIDRDIRISGFYLGSKTKENSLFKNIMNLRKVSNLMRSDMKINVRGRFTLERVQEAVDTYLQNMSAGKVLIVND